MNSVSDLIRQVENCSAHLGFLLWGNREYGGDQDKICMIATSYKTVKTVDSQGCVMGVVLL